ncbi:hypothetical protein PTTG_06025 [Puccinia triticina 1-1 BBBD Race 1]|uniref:Uncharacterized protein n=1 Tax=Puccinia triticina (isolate 1-1 / race 1 (BBBD)) TaxID=630390 RepID=A0A180GD16_PUCT1|nr:hypothetical protein PTTG_06025 [Puccinia triticina 1-1 BBBD Race 1]
MCPNEKTTVDVPPGQNQATQDIKSTALGLFIANSEHAKHKLFTDEELAGLFMIVTEHCTSGHWVEPRAAAHGCEKEASVASEDPMDEAVANSTAPAVTGLNTAPAPFGVNKEASAAFEDPTDKGAADTPSKIADKAVADLVTGSNKAHTEACTDATDKERDPFTEEELRRLFDIETNTAPEVKEAATDSQPNTNSKGQKAKLSSLLRRARSRVICLPGGTAIPDCKCVIM